jgi:hypothetical protein
MNKIQAEYKKTEFTNGEHLVMMIDDVQLDKIIPSIDEEGHMTGLVSTLLNGWMDNENESDIVWDRIDLRPNEIKMVPLLMCPDDCDFSCTIIIAEMKLEKGKVHIKKLGIDETSTRDSQPNTVGRNVNWISGLGPYIFDQVEFEKCIKEFKK